VDSPYYSESEFCGGAVTVSFSKYFPWQAMHFLQRSTQSRKWSYSRFKRTRFRWHSNTNGESALRDLKVAMDALTKIGETPLEHPPYMPDLASCDFWAFRTMKRELRGQNRLFHYLLEACDKRSAARFRDGGGSL
jgi:hypothetical protein